MRPLRLELSYFRQFKDIELFFPQHGLIGINGDNGAGKSTILNAMDWVLNGKYKGVNQAQLKTQKSPKSAKTFGVLDFLFNDDFYRVRRDLVTSPSRNYIQKNGMTVAAGTTNINEYVKELFKMDQEAFRTCYYASQFDFDNLAKLKDAPRVEMISKLLRIEKIDIAADKVRSDKRYIETQLEAAKNNLRDENELQLLLKNSVDEQTIIFEEINACALEIKELETQRDILMTQKSESDILFEKNQKIESEISNLETKKQTLTEHSLKNETFKLESLLKKQEKLSTIEHKKDDYYRLSKTKDELNEAKEQYTAAKTIEKQINDATFSVDSYIKQIENAETSLSQFDKLAAIIKELEVNIDEKDAELSKRRDKSQELTTMLNVNKAKYQEIVLEKKQFEQLGADVPCPTCKRPLGEHLEQELNRIEASRKTLIFDTAVLSSDYDACVSQGKKEKKVLEELKKTLKDYIQKMSFKSGFESQKEIALSEKRKNETKLIELQSARKELPDKIDFDEESYKSLINEIKLLVPIYEEIIQLQQAVQEIPKIESIIEKTNEQITEITHSISLKTDDCKNLNFDINTHRTLNENIERLRSKIDSSKDIKYGLNTKNEISKTNTHNISEEIKRNKEKFDSLKEFQDEIIHLTKLDQIYKTYKKDILGKLSPKLSELMSELIETATNGKYDRIQLDDYYNIFIYRDGEKLPLDMFSGSEQQLAALCQRIAISQILVEQTGQASFDMIALDECFSAMDSKRTDSMVDMFRGLNEVFPQIIIVSHDEHVKDLFDHTLHIQLNNDLTSSAKWIKDDNGNETWYQEEVSNIISKFTDIENVEETETEAQKSN